MIKPSYLLTCVLPGMLLAAVFYPILEPLTARFDARDSYYSHGYLIPFVSLYLAWRSRAALLAAPVQPAFLGLFLILGGLILHLVSLSLKINFTSYLAFPVVLSGLILFLAGWPVLKILLFPIGFLVFMLPLPSVMIIGISLRMKFLATQIASWIMNLSGVETSMSGSHIYYPGGFLVVGDPCSGLRSLITFLALGALLTQIVQGPLWKRLTLLVSVIPIAVLSNVARIIFLVLLSFLYGSQAVTGFWHDFAGIMVFVVAFLGLMGMMSVLSCRFTNETL